MEYNNNDLIEYLTKHQIKPSTIRIKTLGYLLKNKNHPTVDDIYKSLKDEIPTLSKTSIYNTLDLFLEKGVVKILSLQEKELRYDIDTNIHAHFKCEKCGKLYDFPISPNFFSEDSLDGFIVNDRDIHLYGICKECNR
ncbi:Fur family transcriptional regulator [Tepidimicrobium xylanilyticum]|uniref:Fur family transcriptional regulator, peroxide stress response regulator n=1 Tax=Tepidimicrobium xylanilyticum TaxID=1123352 RepID=A0A1H2QIY7_9FIRM|nr:Fur family transcriptional regulator [Tepidimicrobium xylanilyticum]GMG95648.1 transcriptional repressor [Tepidimicrobium xylanilyticum]SDW07045.1 Fur family transcriptional regulator, peroxide stress response regulator [Tepidimicrobium xylanilyticum]